MHILFVHQNFPAQFRYIAPRLISDFGHQVTFVTERAEGDIRGVRKVLYKARGGATAGNHVCTRNFENAVAHAHGVFEAMKASPDVRPDLVVAHTGFGSSLFLPFLYDAPVINFLEFFYHPVGQDLGYRPEVPVDEIALLRSRTNNAMILLDTVNCDRGWTPTHYQRGYFPPELRQKIDVIFDGIDTAVYHRIEGARERLAGELKIPPHHRVVTYVARGFEMMRGFDVFMKAARRIYEQLPDVTFVVVGTDKVHYGGDMKYIKEPSFRHHVLAEGGYDLSRFRFTGFVAQERLAEILSLGDVHIYLTEPFIASWSMVDAMACGAVVLASDQTCVREYIEPERDGLLVDFFDFEGLARRALDVLKDPPAYRHIGEAAAKKVSEHYSLDVAIPRINELFHRVAATKRDPSVRLERLVRAGTMKRQVADPDLAASRAASPTAGGAGAATSPIPSGPPPDVPENGTEVEKAVAMLRRASFGGNRQPQQWVQVSQAFTGPGPTLTRIGPSNHPTDLTRLLIRLGQWNASLILDVGAEEGGTVFLWSRVALPNAKIIVAPLPGQTLPPEKVEFFGQMGQPDQRVLVLPPAESAEKIERSVEEALAGRKLDFLFIHARRPFKQVQTDFRHYRKRVRDGGLIAWDGINPIAGHNGRDGGDKLWAEQRLMYPQKAEYLNGAATEFGGIAVIKL